MTWTVWSSSILSAKKNPDKMLRQHESPALLVIRQLFCVCWRVIGVSVGEMNTFLCFAVNRYSLWLFSSVCNNPPLLLTSYFPFLFFPVLSFPIFSYPFLILPLFPFPFFTFPSLSFPYFTTHFLSFPSPPAGNGRGRANASKRSLVNEVNWDTAHQHAWAAPIK